jgi:hypothetical protein
MGDLNEDKLVVDRVAYSYYLSESNRRFPTGDGVGFTKKYARYGSRVRKGRKRPGLLCGQRLQGASEI